MKSTIPLTKQPSNMNGIDAESEHCDVLHISEAFGGGIQTAIANYMRNTPELMHGLLVRKREKHDVGENIDCALQKFYSGSLLDFLLFAANYITQTRPKVVHIHSGYAGVLRAMEFPHTRIVYTPHAYAFYRADISRSHRGVIYVAEKLLSKRRQTIAAISPHEAQIAQKLAGRNTRVTYLPNVDCANPQFTSRTTEDSRRIVTVGRVSPQKDPMFAANVASALAKKAEWTWVGDGDEDSKDALREAGITVTGWVENEEVRNIVARASLYVHTARWEGAPMTMLEAAAAGVPVLARNIPSLEGLGYPALGATPAEAAKRIQNFFETADYRNHVTRATRNTVKVHSNNAQKVSLECLYSSTSPIADRPSQ